MRQKNALTAADAQRIVEAAVQLADQRQWRVSIAVVDEGGFLLRLVRLDGAMPMSPEAATMKARSAAVYRLPTKRLEDTSKDRPGLLGLPGRLAVQGGLPIMHEGECVGAVGVSGVQSHEDEEIAAFGIAALVV